MKELFNRFRRSGHMPLAVMAAVSVLSLVFIYAHYTKASAERGRAYDADKVRAARYSATRVRQFLEDERDNLAGISAALSLAGDIGRGRPLAEAQFWSGVRKRKLVSFFVLDPAGRFLYSAPEQLIDRRMQDLSAEPYFIEAVKGGRFHMGAARSDGKGGWEVVLAVPVYSGGADGRVRFLGVAAERLDVRVLEDVLTDGIEQGDDVYAMLVDDSGRVLAGDRSGMLYQVENSSPLLQKMISGEEGSLHMGGDEKTARLVAYSPVRFEGRIWSAGVAYPAMAARAGSWRELALSLAVAGFMSIAFAWSLVSLVGSGRGRRGARERERLAGLLALRDREMATLDDLTRSLGAVDDTAGMLRSAVAIIKADTGASGAAVRVVPPQGGGLVLAAQTGIPEMFAEAGTCPSPADCYCSRVMADGVPAVMAEALPGPERHIACGCRARGALVLVPLRAGGRSLGVLYLTGLGEEAAADRLRFLEAAAGHIAVWMENIGRIEDANRNAAMAGALFNTAQALTRSLDLDELLRIIMAEAASLLKVERCQLLLYNEEMNRVDCRMALGFDCQAAGAASFSPSGVFWEAMEDGGVKVVDPRNRKHDVPREFIEQFGKGPFILVTLSSKGRVLGFLVLDTGGRSGAVVPDELKLIMGFASQAALAIETSSYYIRTVEKYNEDLQRLSGRIIEAQEEERKRISRDLHDELGQILTAVKISLDLTAERMSTDPRQVAGRLAEAAGLTASALDSVRRLSFELRPPMLDDLGLDTVLGKLINDFRRRSGLEVEFTVEGPDHRLPPGHELTLYRVVQEALTNVLRHSDASRVAVRLSRDPAKGTAGLYIEDDGAGFDPGREESGGKDGGFGLMGIKERVSLLGGNFRIFAGEGKGVRILVDIPWNKGG
ncbi:MAG: GAF domain-containing protein [Nitrospirae bacterium]|nr:GAF domain-containing protein [Nitrospirota bacterium]